MKIALVHDYLNQLGGGERVLDALLQLYPDADVYTLLHDEVKTRGLYKEKVVGTSFLDFPFARRHHRLFIPLMPLAAKSINLKDTYDLIISDTAGFAKGITYNQKTTKHLSYIHTPLRYAWETKTYFNDSVKNRMIRFFGAPAFAYVRRSDYWAGQKPDILLANSHYIAGKVKEYYGREAAVVYPPVNTATFYPEAGHGNYYLALGRFLEYKRFDLIIDAFIKLGLPLKVVGAGRQELSLRTRSKALSAGRQESNNIEFLPFQPKDEDLRRLYSGAKAFIMANEEDFGLVMAEAQACGTPVIAYNAGGAKEIVADGEQGVLFNEQTPESLVEAVRRFETMTFDPASIAASADRFSKQQFMEGISQAVSELLK